MVFSSILFIFYFLPAFLCCYYLTGKRNAVLLLGSLIFYIWGEGAYVLLLGALVVFAYATGLLIERASGWKRTTILTLGVAGFLLALGGFKYLPFLAKTLSSINVLIGLSPLPQIVTRLPLGISFFTFQLVSYLIDVNRKSIPAERNPLRLATYIMMFPHLIAGPIVRYGEIADALKQRTVTSEWLGLGIQYFMVGLCQKVLIANTLAPAADAMYALPLDQISVSAAWIGVLSYTFQIYFDFCGYSNMAIGLAFMLGFQFPKNFDYPYSATSVTDFWRRWHMTLSFWFRDYVYIPLGGNRGSQLMVLRNLLIVFFLTGLWHGAAWTFIFWGLYHGAFLLLERIGIRDGLARLHPSLRIAYTFLVVMIGWVFFRAGSFHQAATILGAMIGASTGVPYHPIGLWFTAEAKVALIVGMVLSFPAVPALFDRLGQKRVEGSVAADARLSTFNVHPIPIFLLIPAFMLCHLLLASGTLNPFLYFRF
jgi:alginate O-acetyltransferase complex protein AlgI